MNKIYKPKLTQFLLLSPSDETLHTYTTESFGGYGVIEDFVIRNPLDLLLIGERNVDSGKGFNLRKFGHGRKYIEKNFFLYKGRYEVIKDLIPLE